MDYRFNHVVGNTESYKLTLRMTDEAGNPTDLTGHEVSIVRKERVTGDILDTHTAEITGNDVEFLFEHDWAVGKYAYHIEDVSPEETEWLLYGTITVSAA